MAQHHDIKIHLPEVSSYKYKEHLKDIEDNVKKLNAFSNNFQSKLGHLLKQQENEFVNSYKSHMFKIEQTLKEYQSKVQAFQNKILYYQNEGALSILMNKKKLLTEIDKKQKIISALKGDIQTKQREISSLHRKIKNILRNGPDVDASHQTLLRDRSSQYFPTEIQTIDRNTNKSIGSIDNGKKYQTFDNPEHIKQPYLQKIDVKKINKQIEYLKVKNRQLSSVNSKIIQKSSNIQTFFLSTIDQLKKKIEIRKKMHPVSFEDFKKQDKIELLIKVLSNQEILQHLYNKIFMNDSKNVSSVNPQLSKSIQRNNYSQNGNYSNLPAIRTNRL